MITKIVTKSLNAPPIRYLSRLEYGASGQGARVTKGRGLVAHVATQHVAKYIQHNLIVLQHGDKV
jgi:hypothetical protein